MTRQVNWAPDVCAVRICIQGVGCDNTEWWKNGE